MCWRLSSASSTENSLPFPLTPPARGGVGSGRTWQGSFHTSWQFEPGERGHLDHMGVLPGGPGLPAGRPTLPAGLSLPSAGSTERRRSPGREQVPLARGKDNERSSRTLSPRSCHLRRRCASRASGAAPSPCRELGVGSSTQGPQPLRRASAWGGKGGPRGQRAAGPGRPRGEAAGAGSGASRASPASPGASPSGGRRGCPGLPQRLPEGTAAGRVRGGG